MWWLCDSSSLSLLRCCLCVMGCHGLCMGEPWPWVVLFVSSRDFTRKLGAFLY